MIPNECHCDLLPTVCSRRWKENIICEKDPSSKSLSSDWSYVWESPPSLCPHCTFFPKPPPTWALLGQGQLHAGWPWSCKWAAASRLLAAQSHLICSQHQFKSSLQTAFCLTRCPLHKPTTSWSHHQHYFWSPLSCTKRLLSLKDIPMLFPRSVNLVDLEYSPNFLYFIPRSLPSLWAFFPGFQQAKQLDCRNNHL